MVLWGGVGGVLCKLEIHIPERGLWLLSKDQGLVVVSWAK